MNLLFKTIQYFVLKLKNKGLITDGYHSFNDLYSHRNALYIALLKEKESRRIADNEIRATRYGEIIGKESEVWRSHFDSEGNSMGDWFLLGYRKTGKQITYHLPNELWDKCDFAEVLVKSPIFDGHTSEDVLKRLQKL